MPAEVTTYYPIIDAVNTEEATLRSAEIAVTLTRTEWLRIGHPVQLKVTIEEVIGTNDAAAQS